MQGFCAVPLSDPEGMHTQRVTWSARSEARRGREPRRWLPRSILYLAGRGVRHLSSAAHSDSDSDSCDESYGGTVGMLMFSDCNQCNPSQKRLERSRLARRHYFSWGFIKAILAFSEVFETWGAAFLPLIFDLVILSRSSSWLSSWPKW